MNPFNQIKLLKQNSSILILGLILNFILTTSIIMWFDSKIELAKFLAKKEIFLMLIAFAMINIKLLKNNNLGKIYYSILQSVFSLIGITVTYAIITYTPNNYKLELVKLYNNYYNSSSNYKLFDLKSITYRDDHNDVHVNSKPIKVYLPTYTDTKINELKLFKGIYLRNFRKLIKSNSKQTNKIHFENYNTNKIYLTDFNSYDKNMIFSKREGEFGNFLIGKDKRIILEYEHEFSHCKFESYAIFFGFESIVKTKNKATIKTILEIYSEINISYFPITFLLNFFFLIFLNKNKNLDNKFFNLVQEKN
jgi:hypothetical protein